MSEQRPQPWVPSPFDRRSILVRRIFLAVVGGSCVVLVPWIGYLAARLPQHYVAAQWKVAWVGFDAALVATLGATAFAAWQRRQVVVPGAVVSGTLLVCDAWFDIVLDWGTPDVTYSVLAAVFAELPLAAVLFATANRIVHAMLAMAWAHLGHVDPPPRLHKVRLTQLFDLPSPVDK